MGKITFTSPNALRAATRLQLRAIARTAERFHQSNVAVGPRSFDLPPGYLTLRIEREDQTSIYGGISKEGDVST